MINYKFSALFALSLTITACEPADAELAETADNAVTPLAAITCNDVFAYVDNPVGPTFSAIAFTYARAGAAMSGTGGVQADSDSVDVTTSEVSSNSYTSVAANRAVINFRKSFTRLGNAMVQRSSRVTVDIYRAANGASFAYFDVGVTGCEVRANDAIVTAEDATGGRLFIVFHHQYIGG